MHSISAAWGDEEPLGYVLNADPPGVEQKSHLRIEKILSGGNVSCKTITVLIQLTFHVPFSELSNIFFGVLLSLKT